MPRGTVWYNFSRATRLEVSNYFIYTKDPLSDDTYDSGENLVVQGNNRSRGQEKYYSNQASARLSHQFGPENTVYAQMAGGFTNYDDPGNATNGDERQRNEDGQWFTPSVGLTYWFSTRNGIESDFSYTRGLYEETASSDFNNYDGRLRFNHRLTQQTGVYGQYRQIYRTWDDPSDTTIDGPGGAGLPRLRPVGRRLPPVRPDPDGLDRRGLLLPAGERRQRPERPVHLIRAQQALGFSALEHPPADRKRHRQPGLHGRPAGLRALRAGRRGHPLQLHARFLRRPRAWASAIPTTSTARTTKRTIRYTAEVGLGYTITRWATVRVAYAFNKLDAINSTEDYEQNRVFVTLTLSPDQPWRIFD